MLCTDNLETNVISPDDVRRIVDRTLDDCIEVLDYRLSPYSDYQIGFLGSHKNLEVTIKRSNSSQPEKCNYFAKMIPRDSIRNHTFIKQRKVFDQEAVFYNAVMPRLLESYDDESWGPKCYLANEDVIVLEDLRAKGFKMRDSKVFDRVSLRSAAKALARMHVCSILAERRLGRPLRDVFPEACVEQIFNQNSKDRGSFALLIELAERVARKHGMYHRGGIASAFELVYDRIQNSKSKNQVICHADSWSNNLMFNADEPPKCLVIDFQLTRYANRMWDIAQLVYFSTTREVRAREEADVIKVYHEEFTRVTSKHDSTLQLPSLADTMDEYEEARLPALFAAMFYYPFMLVRKEEFVKHKDDPEAIYNKYILRVNNEEVLSLMKRDEEYEARITETALELIEYCERFASVKSNGI